MRVLFMGTPAFAVPSLAAVAEHHELVAVVTRPDKGRGRGQRTASSAVKEWAVDAGVAIEQPRTLRDADVVATLAGYRADVVVVVAYGLILPPPILQMPRLGCVNVHASLLPRHRGAAPIAWAILAGDDKTGVTTMLMDQGLDTGPKLLERAMSIGPGDTTGTLTPALAADGADLLIETLAGLESGALVAEPQDDARSTRAPSFTKRDGLLDWSLAAQQLDRQIRALQPWPGTFTFWGGDRLSVWAVAVSELADAEADPGTVVEVAESGILVCCGNGTVLRILELQRSGGKRQRAADFLRGRPIGVGERFGTAIA